MISRISEEDFPDTRWETKRGEWGYAYDEARINPSEENLLFLMEKINELIDHINEEESE